MVNEAKGNPGGSLRRNAEGKLRERKKGKPVLRGVDAQRLIHELEVHRVELELQNAALRSARAELEAALERYTELFDHAPIGYAVLTPDGIIRSVNSAGAGVLGSERARLVGLRMGAFVDDADFDLFNSTIRRRIGAEGARARAIRLTGRGGAPKTITLTTALLPRDEPLVIAAFQDVTEDRKREEQLAQVEVDLRETQIRKDEFLAVLSHELRNPLAPMRNSLFVLEKAPPGGEQARRALRIIDRQLSHLTRLVDDLLDVTRIARGKIQPRLSRVEVGYLVRQAIDDRRMSFEASGIRLEADLEPANIWAFADGTRLIQALSNLLCNAEKFTPRGGRVTVWLRREGPFMVVGVRDTGIGIARDQQSHLFMPFAQAPQTTDRARGGLGLGLAMVKGFVEIHGGSVAIHSDGPGMGTEVVMRLPLERGPRESEPPSIPPPGACRKVLVIEDNADAGDSLKEALELIGHDVNVARNGRKGLELAHEFHPEIVICDVGLPEMDGYAVARAFRADPELSGIYLVALSGYAQPDDKKRAKEAGFDKHIAKPPLLETLEKLMSGPPAAS